MNSRGLSSSDPQKIKLQSAKPREFTRIRLPDPLKIKLQSANPREFTKIKLIRPSNLGRTWAELGQNLCIYTYIHVLYTSICIDVTLGLKPERGAPSLFLYVFYRSKWVGGMPPKMGHVKVHIYIYTYIHIMFLSPRGGV